MRGHDLGHLIFSAEAKKNTGITGVIKGLPLSEYV